MNRRQSLRLCPSAAWMDHAIAGGAFPLPDDAGPRGRRANAVRMRACPSCGRIYPPAYFSGDACEDCRAAATVPDDDRAIALRAEFARRCRQAGLTTDERSILLAVAENLTPHAIGELFRQHHSWADRILKRAMGKLAAIGVTPPEPEQNGAAKPRMIATDPAAFSRMVLTKHNGLYRWLGDEVTTDDDDETAPRSDKHCGDAQRDVFLRPAA